MIKILLKRLMLMCAMSVVLINNISAQADKYRLAASKGDANAQYALGRCYAQGDGVEQSYSEAIKWYSKAAKKGNCDAL